MNKIKGVIRHILSILFKLLLLRHLDVCTTGVGSRVNFWRIRPCSGGSLVIGDRSMIRAEMVFEREGVSIIVGDRTFVGRGLFTIADRLEIGNDVMISWNVTIVDHNSHSLKFSERCNDVEMNAFQGKKNWNCVKIAPVIIEDKAWIGFGCSILKGVTIGEGAVVGANSLVTKDVAPWTVVAGSPARLIREIPVNER